MQNNTLTFHSEVQITQGFYFKMKNLLYRVYGNSAIAIGGILPGIGGSFTRAGYVEVLFVTELVGLALIYIGYKIIKYNSSLQVS